MRTHDQSQIKHFRDLTHYYQHQDNSFSNKSAAGSSDRRILTGMAKELYPRYFDIGREVEPEATLDQILDYALKATFFHTLRHPSTIEPMQSIYATLGPAHPGRLRRK